MSDNVTDLFHRRLAAADARIERGNRERTAGADDRARAIAEEAARRGRGGPRQLSIELDVSEKTISQAIARARRAGDDNRHTLPADTLQRLLAAELNDLPPLAGPQWRALRHLVRSTFIDEVWIEAPGELLAQEVQDADLAESFRPAELAEVCRSWSRAQALAVIDACQRDDLTALPVVGEG
ncbi:hypothetical protein ACF053_30040 [Streptomyces kanasensis]|uniref:hypothetical protein n=1 Tax=Streptomyces kanasensis TaxID=936756 RepID=UPI0036F9B75B